MFFVELALSFLLPVLLPIIVAVVALAGCSFIHFKLWSRCSTVAIILSVIFAIAAVWWSLRFPSSMSGDWLICDVIPFLNVTFY